MLRGLSYKEVLGTNKSFKDPIPLVDMVEFLVNVWELEGVF